jgi:hypothetical protein
MVKKTAMAVKAPETPAVKLPETPAVKAPETPAVKVPKMPALKAPETPAVKAPETTPAVKASTAMKPAAAVTAAATAPSPKPPVSDSIGRRSDYSGSDNTGQEKLQLHKQPALSCYIIAYLPHTSIEIIAQSQPERDHLFLVLAVRLI